MQSQANFSVGDEQQETIGLTLHLSTMSDREQISLTSNLCVLTGTYIAGSWVLETLKARLIFESKDRLEQICCHKLLHLDSKRSVSADICRQYVTSVGMAIDR